MRCLTRSTRSSFHVGARASCEGEPVAPGATSWESRKLRDAVAAVCAAERVRCDVVAGSDGLLFLPFGERGADSDGEGVPLVPLMDCSRAARSERSTLDREIGRTVRSTARCDASRRSSFSCRDLE